MVYMYHSFLIPLLVSMHYSLCKKLDVYIGRSLGMLKKLTWLSQETLAPKQLI